MAAVWVVVMHAMYEWNVVFRSGERHTNLIAGAGLWVHFFFILSGFVLAYAYEREFAVSIQPRPYLRFLWVRFGRIYPLYVTILLLWVAGVSAGWIEANRPSGSLLASFLLTQGFLFGDDVWNYPGWSISAEWLAYCVFPLIAFGVVRATGRALLAVGAMLATAIVMLWGLGPHTSTMPAISAVYCLLELSLGCVVFRLAEANHGTFRLGPRLAAAVCLLPIILLALPPSPASGWLLGIAAVCCALTIFVVATHRTAFDPFLQSRPMQFLGVVSYSIYLLHALLFRVVKNAVDGLTGHHRVIAGLSSVESLIAFAGYLVLLVLLSWISYRTIEEPARTWFKRIGSRSFRTKQLTPSTRPSP